VVGLLCRTPLKESRHELLRRVAAGGGAFKSKNGTKVHIPGANLNDIANQADDLVEVITESNLLNVGNIISGSHVCVYASVSYYILPTFFWVTF